MAVPRPASPSNLNRRGVAVNTYPPLDIYVFTDSPPSPSVLEVVVKRRPYPKGKARKQFVARSSKTARVNLASPLRGGIRL